MPPEPPGSITRWINDLRAGNPAAASPLWHSYFDKLVHLARAALGAAPRAAVDDEDVALSAFDALSRGLVEGRFPDLRDRTDLWRLLVVITAQKALDQFSATAG